MLFYCLHYLAAIFQNIHQSIITIKDMKRGIATVTIEVWRRAWKMDTNKAMMMVYMMNGKPNPPDYSEG